MKVQVKINYEWWNADKTEIKINHQEILEENAMEIITEMMSQGFTSGELNSYVRVDEADGEDGIPYKGFWSINTEKL